MTRSLMLALTFSVFLAATGEATVSPSWPSLTSQLQADRVAPRSALAALITANQDFSILRPEEAKDRIPVPLWLRVYWRKGHPEGKYSGADPTGGYPHVLKEIHEWMVTHQDLVPGPGDADALPDGDEELPSKTSVSGEKRISGAQTARRSESDIRVNYWDPMKIIGASNNISGGGMQAQFYSTDGGVTWGQTSLPLQGSDSFHSDPTVDWTSDGTAWSTTIGIVGNTLQMRAYKSTDNGATWTFDATFSGSQTSADKQLMWVDHSATSPFKDNVYVIWHNGNPAYMNRRTGPAGSWGTPVQVSGSETTGTGIGGDVKTNAFGDVFGFWPDTGSRGLYVVKSTNGGASYGAAVRIATAFDGYDIGVPAMNNRRALIYASGGAYRTATKNLVYAAWTDLTGATGCASSGNEPGSNTASTCKSRIWFARSTDGGATWAPAVMINNQASLNDQFNQAMVVDETNGAIEVMYYDTVADPGRKKVDVWQQSSYDDGVTWSAAVKVTSAQTDETVAGADSGNQFGDYNSFSGIASQFFPSWTDRRSNSREEIWTARITDVPCTAPGSPAIGTATASAPNQIQVTWGNGSPSASSFNVYRASGTCASHGDLTKIASAVAGSPYTDGTVAGTLTYAYQVTGLDATGHCESGPSACVQATATGTCGLAPTFAGLASVSNQAAATCGLTLSWAASTAVCTGPVTYNVYRSTTSGFTPGPGNRLASGVTGTSYSDTSGSLASGTAYYYVVRAVDASNGVEEGNSVQRSTMVTGPITNLVADTFETAGGFDAAGWTHSAVSGTADWAWSTVQSKSPTHSWFSDSQVTASDRVLVSPSFVPAVGSSLSFWHTYAFESPSGCFDGGTLESSIDGGATWQVIPDAAFSAGGFTGTVSTAYSNPIGGRKAWCGGTIGAMTQVLVDLSSFAGSNTKLRWHAGDDSSVKVTGWYVDSVTITGPAVCSSAGLLSDGFESGDLSSWSGWTP